MMNMLSDFIYVYISMYIYTFIEHQRYMSCKYIILYQSWPWSTSTTDRMFTQREAPSAFGAKYGNFIADGLSFTTW